MMIFESLKDLIFPKKCLGCRRWGEYLCSDCLNFIKVCHSRICPVCSRPSIDGLTHLTCQRPQSLDGLTSIFIYQGIIKKVITNLKNRFVTDLGKTILELFLSFAGEDKVFTEFVTRKNVLLIPVPLYWQRKNWRGFNQAELLGKMIAKKLGIGFLPDLLVRIEDSKSKGAFRINNKWSTSKLKSKNILLFDDIWLTGTTMRECTKVLKRKEVKKVWGLTLARQKITLGF